MEPGKIYHIYNRGVNKQPIFFDNENYIYFLKQFDKYVSAKVDVLAYCLMPNHFHLLVRIRMTDGMPIDEISASTLKSFRDFLISYAKAINKKYKKTGALFQQKYKRKEVDNDFYLSGLIQYIHMNPVKAGLCDNFLNWRFSSYGAIVSGKPTKVCVSEVLDWFGGLARFIQTHLEKVLDENHVRKFLFDE